MPRFVILYHQMPDGCERPAHWDLMLEADGALWTWALPEPKPGLTCIAERLADHRLFYLDYEGPISGGRGTVTRWDAGDYEVVEENEQRLVVTLTGGRIAGTLTIEQEERKNPGQPQRVRVSFSK